MRRNLCLTLVLVMAVLLGGCLPAARSPRAALVLRPDNGWGVCPMPEDMLATKVVLEQRLKTLKVGLPQVEVEGEGCASRITASWLAGDNSESVVAALHSPGMLEFVEIGQDADVVASVQPGVYLRTTSRSELPLDAAAAQVLYPDRVFQTVLTGALVAHALRTLDEMRQPQIEFKLTPDGRAIFAEYTAAHVGDVLAIAMDNRVIVAPRINSAIPEGEGVIAGRFTTQEADAMVAQIMSGALPVPLAVEAFTVGAAGK